MGGKRGQNRGRPELKGAQRVGKGNKGKAHTPGAGLAQRRVRPLAARPSKLEALPLLRGIIRFRKRRRRGGNGSLPRPFHIPFGGMPLGPPKCL